MSIFNRLMCRPFSLTKKNRFQWWIMLPEVSGVGRSIFSQSRPKRFSVNSAIARKKTKSVPGHLGPFGPNPGRFGPNPGRFGPGSFRPGSFRPGSFRPNLGVGRFGLGGWVDSALGRFGPGSFRPKIDR